MLHLQSMQANMIWLIKKKGVSYHWLLELFQRLKLPLFDGMAEAVKRGMKFVKNLEKSKQKRQRTNWKKACVQEQEGSNKFHSAHLWLRRMSDRLLPVPLHQKT